MGSFKQITIVGNLGADPITRYTSDGTAVASFNVAVKDFAKKGEDATTSWFKVSAWRRNAEIASEYLKKGSSVLIVGDIKLEEYTAKDGSTRASMAVTAEKVQLMDRKGENHGTSAPAKSNDSWVEEEQDLPF